ncbi:MAG: hypothetical protein HY865_14825 [Chloroflexi bacterium]|nr:hypothetical protein [Chloroflexota bacterium]
MKKTRKPKTLLVIGLMLIISLFFLSGCKSAELRAIEDAASVLQLTKGKEVRRWTDDGGEAMGKPVYPHVLIVYEPINNYTQEEVYAEIVTILESNNWEGNEPNPGRDYFKAYLQQGQFKISTGVAIDDRNNHVTVKMIVY